MKRALWVLTGLAGVGLLVPFDAPVTIAVGLLALVAFIVIGLFLVASPAFTRADLDER